MYMDNISSFLNGAPPLPRDRALQHHCGDYDLKHMKRICDELIAQYNITVDFQHVRAHQDDPKKKINSKVDNLILLA